MDTLAVSRNLKGWTINKAPSQMFIPWVSYQSRCVHYDRKSVLNVSLQTQNAIGVAHTWSLVVLSLNEQKSVPIIFQTRSSEAIAKDLLLGSCIAEL